MISMGWMVEPGGIEPPTSCMPFEIGIFAGVCLFLIEPDISIYFNVLGLMPFILLPA
jgi:hypothetical protein